MKQDMQQDKLEQFITTHRQEFEDKSPGLEIWEAVENKLKGSAKSNGLLIWKIAAALFFATTMGLLVKDYFPVMQDSTEKLATTEFYETESYYTNEIQKKHQLVQISLSNRPVLEEEFNDDWIELEESYKKLREDYKNNTNDQMLDALILNLQAQINLLNSQLNVIKKITLEDEQINI